MKELNAFETKRGFLLAAYDRILRERLVPVASITADAVAERRAALAASSFHITVCGQMNAGKSTLLNAMVLRRPVLPMAATVMTAKVTILQYAAEPAIEVDCYTRSEWDLVSANFLQTEQWRKQFDAELDAAARGGATPNDWITEGGRKERLLGHGGLRRFVGVASAGGVCSPYVKSVRVFHTNTRFRDVVVTDTPGVNDPNAVREQLTREWVQRADAVVYVSYAGQAGLTDSDVGFIDKHLLHVASSRRVIAVNKIDVVSDLQTVEAFLVRLRNHDRGAVRAVFGNPPVLVSAAGGLVQRMGEDGVKLSPELEELRDLLRPTGRLEDHRVEQLENAVGERLMDNRGRQLVESHVGFVSSIFARHEEELAMQGAKVEEHKTLLRSKNDKLAIERMAAEDSRKVLGAIFLRFHEDFDREKDDFRETLALELNAIFRDIDVNVTTAVGRLREIEHFPNEVAWALKRELDDAAVKLRGYRIKAIDRTQQMIRKHLEQMEVELAHCSVLPISRVRTLIDFSAVQHMDALRKMIDEAFGPEKVAAIAREHTNFLQRWFDTAGGLADVRSALKEPMTEMLHAMKASLLGSLEDAFHKRLDPAFQAIEQRFNEAVDARIELIGRLEREQGSREAELKRVDEDLAGIAVKAQRVQTIKQEING